jgi:hypothetical protein
VQMQELSCLGLDFTRPKSRCLSYGARVHALSSPTPLSQLIFTHIFGWTPQVEPKVPALYLRRRPKLEFTAFFPAKSGAEKC